MVKLLAKLFHRDDEGEQDGESVDCPSTDELDATREEKRKVLARIRSKTRTMRAQIPADSVEGDPVTGEHALA